MHGIGTTCLPGRGAVVLVRARPVGDGASPAVAGARLVRLAKWLVRLIVDLLVGEVAVLYSPRQLGDAELIRRHRHLILGGLQPAVKSTIGSGNPFSIVGADDDHPIVVGRWKGGRGVEKGGGGGEEEVTA